MADALRNVKQYFPNVTSVKDSTEPLTVQVTKADINKAERRKHPTCAMAVACKRAFSADGVIISVKTAYVIKGNQATRYRLNESVTREIVAFDRDGAFEAGEYQLNKPAPTERLGARPKPPNWGKKKGNFNSGSTGGNLLKKHIKVHRTTGIRTVLGSSQLST